jgi:hypothetical protein
MSLDGFVAVYDGGVGSADPAARLLALQRKVDNLLVALDSQRVIGVAIGLLAQRCGCSTAEAWDILTRLSQDTNIKVREIARILTDAFDGASRSEDAELLERVNDRLPGGPGA